MTTYVNEHKTTSGGKARHLREEDARAIIRLLGEVAILQGDHHAKKRSLLTGLADIIEADRWGWCQSFLPESPLRDTMAPERMLSDNWEEKAKRALFCQDLTVPNPTALFNHRLCNTATRFGHLTFSPRQFLSDEQWYDSDFYHRSQLPVNTDDLIYSMYASNQGTISGIGFFRSAGAPIFAGRDMFMVHLMMSEVTWLHGDNNDVPGSPIVCGLSQRLSDILKLLLSGDSKKQIAAKLDLSYHTVDDYVKQLHRRLGVQSRGELLARFLAGETSVVAPRESTGDE